MKFNFTLEDIIFALKVVGSNGNADELVSEILGVSVDEVREIKNMFK